MFLVCCMMSMPLQVTAVVRDGPGRRTWSLSVHHSDSGVPRTSPQLRYVRRSYSRMDSTCSVLSIQHRFNLEVVLVSAWTDRTNDDHRKRPGTVLHLLTMQLRCQMQLILTCRMANFAWSLQIRIGQV